ncbi:hypothetical protein [Halalkalibacter akibai]|uniref:Uncharacterized protein n=1 Tax=Halalkalibacter akibai (strain ATCC 43226 / DSM 21942 / CIP 109018 / JCM 9157 / 1139) TaxID=1236973 RepID=W4QMK4_HALA3|nr:hypothetical protein [Halalkalibacter akibai]GAE33127.1 hypothetical protein JCM9157_114 [Halalkalibacter akibai JCM 9157]
MFTEVFYQFYPESNRQFPPVNISSFQQSLTAYQSLLEQGRAIINGLLGSEERMRRLMDAAQRSADEEVDQIIRETGVTKTVETAYNPTGVTFTLREEGCCTLMMNLRWGF